MSLHAQTQTLQITNIPADKMQALKALKCEYGYIDSDKTCAITS